MKRKNKIRIVEKKLGRSLVWGVAYKYKNLIEIEQRLQKKKRLKILCHELCHKAFPNATEREVLKAEQIIGNALWNQNYRRVDQ